MFHVKPLSGIVMSDRNNSYKKLKGSALISSNRLYTGPDHLLSSNSNFFSEEYLRFYYKDIQSIITRKTLTGKILNISFIVILILTLTPALILTRGWSDFFFVLASVFFILLVINLLKGPTSVCHLQTPIQTARLSSIRRIKSAEKALAQLTPLIENSQGTLTEQNFKDIKQYEDSKVSYGKPSSTPTGIPFKKPDTQFRHEEGMYHQATFFLLVLNAVFITVDIFHQNIAQTLLSGAIIMAITVSLIIALIKQSDSNLSKSIKIMAWSTTGYLGLKYIFSYILIGVTTLQNRGSIYNQWTLIKKVSSISPMEHPWILGFSVFSIIFSLIVGITGIVLTTKFQKIRKSIQTTTNPSNEDSICIELDYE